MPTVAAAMIAKLTGETPIKLKMAIATRLISKPKKDAPAAIANESSKSPGDGVEAGVIGFAECAGDGAGVGRCNGFAAGGGGDCIAVFVAGGGAEAGPADCGPVADEDDEVVVVEADVGRRFRAAATSSAD